MHVKDYIVYEFGYLILFCCNYVYWPTRPTEKICTKTTILKLNLEEDFETCRSATSFVNKRISHPEDLLYSISYESNVGGVLGVRMPPSPGRGEKGCQHYLIMY